MIRLSVNVNKVATLRNSRGGQLPSVPEAVDVCLAAGAPGITVHPRADRRHITPDDVREIARCAVEQPRRVEFNIEGDPRPELMALVEDVRPDQCTLVPVAAWRNHEPGWLAARRPDGGAEGRHRAFQVRSGVRVSLFVDARPEPIRWAASGRRRPRGALYRAVRARIRSGRGRRPAVV